MRDSAQTNDALKAPLSLGILGGGQLARMLSLAAHSLGVRPRVFSEQASDPAAQVVSDWTQGSASNTADLRAFLQTCDVVTFESEFMDAKLLGRLSRETGTEIFPKVAHMAIIQDRLTQKRLLEKHRLPTAEWLPVSKFSDARKAWERFGPSGGLVLKKRRFGYDGYGTFVVSSREALEATRLEIENDRSENHGFIAEKLVRFRKEAACILVRGRKGPALHFPFVETKQVDSRCLWVKGPCRIAGVQALAPRLLKFMDDLGYVGVLGVELFDTPKGLLINELAPRVHNSGHYSIEALFESQFQAHVRASLGLPLSKPKLLAEGFAMLNLLGDDAQKIDQTADHTPKATSAMQSLKQNYILAPPEIAVHWYGKAESRPGRKMGHLTALARSPDSALLRLISARAKMRI